MTRWSLKIMLLITLAVGATGCRQIGAASLTQQQIQEFIREKNIQPLVVEDVEGSVTVVLYKDAKEMGCYIAFASNGIEAMQLRNPLLNLRGDAIDPVSFVYKSVIYHDIVCLTINDANILSKAHTIKVLFPDGPEVSAPLKNNGNMIVYRNTKNGAYTITIIIYDSNQKEIIRSPFW